MNRYIVFLLIGLVLILIPVLFFILRALRNGNGQGGIGGRLDGQIARTRQMLSVDVSGEGEEALVKSIRKKRKVKKKPMSLEARFNAAGMFTQDSREAYKRLQVIGPLAGLVFGGVLGLWYMGGGALGIVICIACAYAGYFYPSMMLDKRIKRRQEDTMFYLPLVIEEISIGVSSSLDIGPCIKQVVMMSKERGSSNVVIELLDQVLNYVRSGISFDDALEEIGMNSNIPDIKHTFSSLGQVSKHGGEISKQLQELADAIATQRETMIDAKIKKLELKASGPLSITFLGFLIILVSGLVVKFEKL